MISHAIPGRIRLRHSASLSLSALADLTARVRAVAPSAVLEHNPRARSTLVLFQEKELSSRVLALFPREDRPLPSRNRGAISRPAGCWPHMRQIKRGMTVSLLASLGLLAAGQKGTHGVMGGIFLGLLSRHLWVYRKNIWK